MSFLVLVFKKLCLGKPFKQRSWCPLLIMALVASISGFILQLVTAKSLVDFATRGHVRLFGFTWPSEEK